MQQAIPAQCLTSPSHYSLCTDRFHMHSSFLAGKNEREILIIQFLLELLLVILVSVNDTLVSLSLQNNENEQIFERGKKRNSINLAWGGWIKEEFVCELLDKKTLSRIFRHSTRCFTFTRLLLRLSHVKFTCEEIICWQPSLALEIAVSESRNYIFNERLD